MSGNRMDGRPRAYGNHARGTVRYRRALFVIPLVLIVLAAGTALVMALDGPSWRAKATALPSGTPASIATSSAASPSPAISSRAPSASPSRTARPVNSGWPGPQNTGVPAGVKLHSCGTTLTVGKTYDSCLFHGDVVVHASNVKITRSLVKGMVDAGSGQSGQQTGLVVSDTTIDCGCLADDTHAPAAVSESNFTLLRVNIFHSGHGAAVKNNVTIQDSYIHGLGANSDAHKDGIFSGDGGHVVIRHNNIECNDGSKAGCTAAIGLLVDFGPISYYVIDNNLLNTNGSYCFYGSGGPSKGYNTDHIVFTNNHFGRMDSSHCGFYGPVTYFDVNRPGNVWSGNVWDDTHGGVPATY